MTKNQKEINYICGNACNTFRASDTMGIQWDIIRDITMDKPIIEESVINNGN